MTKSFDAVMHESDPTQKNRKYIEKGAPPPFFFYQHRLN